MPGSARPIFVCQSGGLSGPRNAPSPEERLLLSTASTAKRAAQQEHKSGPELNEHRCRRRECARGRAHEGLRRVGGGGSDPPASNPSARKSVARTSDVPPQVRTLVSSQRGAADFVHTRAAEALGSKSKASPASSSSLPCATATSGGRRHAWATYCALTPPPALPKPPIRARACTPSVRGEGGQGSERKCWRPPDPVLAMACPFGCA